MTRQAASLLALLPLFFPFAFAQSDLRLTYMGTAGWEIASGKTVILVDPYLTRAKYSWPNDGVNPSFTDWIGLAEIRV